MLGVIQAAWQQLRDNRLSSILDAVRVETEDELLDQALALVSAKQLAAADSFRWGLGSYCVIWWLRTPLAIAGDGSIGKYDAAIAKARNDGTASVYAVTDSKLVGGWGGIRNDAAHDPGALSRSPEEVRRMIESIREFISRTS